jgi:hypothetical protein
MAKRRPASLRSIDGLEREKTTHNSHNEGWWQGFEW